jgi:hypothetical protein
MATLVEFSLQANAALVSLIWKRLLPSLYIPIHYWLYYVYIYNVTSETVLVYSPISRSLHSNGCTHCFMYLYNFAVCFSITIRKLVSVVLYWVCKFLWQADGTWFTRQGEKSRHNEAVTYLLRYFTIFWICTKTISRPSPKPRNISVCELSS